MNIHNIQQAKEEAQRFLKKVEDVEARYAKEGRSMFLCGCSETGAVRRSSLDLSKALSDMRK
jgi:hypothetical protein